MVFRPGNTPHNKTDTAEKLRERFYEKVDVKSPEDCWLWNSELTRAGYGRIKICGHRKLAHRVSFEMHHGSIDPGMIVCHKCDTPACVNPEHLFQGTSKDNRIDCTSKMRHAYGSMSPNSILTEDLVREIKNNYKYGNLNQREAARKYGVSHGLIGHIVHGRAWKHV